VTNIVSELEFLPEVADDDNRPKPCFMSEAPICAYNMAEMPCTRRALGDRCAWQELIFQRRTRFWLAQFGFNDWQQEDAFDCASAIAGG